MNIVVRNYGELSVLVNRESSEAEITEVASTRLFDGRAVEEASISVCGCSIVLDVQLALD